jgi:hypothetical protein
MTRYGVLWKRCPKAFELEAPSDIEDETKERALLADVRLILLPLYVLSDQTWLICAISMHTNVVRAMTAESRLDH